MFKFLKSPSSQWESAIKGTLSEKVQFLNSICKINENEALVFNERFFSGLKFPLISKIFLLVDEVVASGGFDPDFKEVIYDRLLSISDVQDLYPEEYVEGEDNIIFGEGYYVYTACYEDLALVKNFIAKHEEIRNICDLGAGSGRSLFYLNLMTQDLNRDFKYIGLELVDERVQFTNSLVLDFELKNMMFKTCDFIKNPEAFRGFDGYYVFDPVGTDDVPKLASHFKDLIASGKTFYIFFISGWDEMLLNALESLSGLVKIEGHKSHKQEGRVVNFYKCN